MPTLTVTLITGRTIEQGVSKEKGKFTEEYQQNTAICILDPADMRELGIEENASIQVRTEHGSTIVRAVVSKRAPHQRIAFIPYGPWANMIVDPATGGTGMPQLKGIQAQIETAPSQKTLSLKELLKEAFRKNSK